MKTSSKKQSDKFKDLAREVDADEDEKAFDEKLRRMKGRKDDAKRNDKDQE